MNIQNKLEALLEELAALEADMGNPDIVSNQERYRQLTRRHAELSPLASRYSDYQTAQNDLQEATELLAAADDDEMREYLQGIVDEATEQVAGLEQSLLTMLLPRDPMNEKNAVLEIRAGTGGDEAALFAGDLLDLYSRLAERRGWKVEVVDVTPGEMGGYKEIIVAIAGRDVYGTLRHESGVHRVQRVPATESQGRIHTSAATVAVLPEVDEVDVVIDPGELSFEAFRAGGPGGQHMQKNETAVRVTHKPTGISVACSDQRSQGQNRERALKMLRSRIYDIRMQEAAAALAKERKEQVKSGDRSEKIRTYNYPQDRLTDHRINMTLHNLPVLMTGEIDGLLEALQEADSKQRLEDMQI